MAHWVTDANGKRIKVAGNYSLKERQAFLIAHPIGSYYMSEDSTDPAELYGGGWEKVEGQFLLGASSGYPVGATGGSATHTLTESEMPSHYHRLASNTVSGSSSVISVQSVYAGSDSYASQFITGNAGSGKAHNNLPPYRATNIWYRYQ